MRDCSIVSAHDTTAVRDRQVETPRHSGKVGPTNPEGATHGYGRRVRQGQASSTLTVEGIDTGVNAGTLKRGDRRTRTIGLSVGDVANPFSGSVGRAVEDVVTAHGSVVLTSSLDDDPAREERVVARLIQRRVDGLVLTLARSDQSYLVREQERAIAFGGRAPTGIVAEGVVTDNTESSAAAVRHLVHHGRRRIAHLGDRPQLWTAHERLRRLGLSHRVALVGFDDIPLGDLVEPTITVVRQEPYEIGRRTAELVLARLGDPAFPPRTRVIPSTLVPGGSGEIQPEAA